MNRCIGSCIDNSDRKLGDMSKKIERIKTRRPTLTDLREIDTSSCQENNLKLSHNVDAVELAIA